LMPNALKQEELQRICVDFDFDDEKISEYLQCLEIDDKYRDVAGYQWQETKSKEQKANEKKMKRLQEQRFRDRAERRRAMLEEKEARRVEREHR